ncbi:hypothetical protein Y032_0186g1065 [Ancylostoma ceylanicum]|nr:hypothetical protein Y032_0186g1065 [Ancylostoma ceylanicum]
MRNLLSGYVSEPESRNNSQHRIFYMYYISSQTPTSRAKAIQGGNSPAATQKRRLVDALDCSIRADDVTAFK